MFSLDINQDLKIKARNGIIEDDELNTQLVEIYTSVQSIKDLSQVFWFCQKHGFKCRAYILDNTLTVYINIDKKTQIELWFETRYDVFALLKD